MAERIYLADADEGLVDVQHAAALVGRHPETIRRWIWSGRLTARRRGNRLFVARTDLEAVLPDRDTAAGLRQWAEEAAASRLSGRTRRHPGAADLVLEDRRQRSQRATSGARR